MMSDEKFKQSVTARINSENVDLMLLRECLIEFRNSGMNAENMRRNLEEMRVGSSEEAENILLELLDFVTGFCNPALRIF